MLEMRVDALVHPEAVGHNAVAWRGRAVIRQQSQQIIWVCNPLFGRNFSSNSVTIQPSNSWGKTARDLEKSRFGVKLKMFWS
jgi:hypothetical protein